MIRFKKIQTIVFSAFVFILNIIPSAFANGKYAKVVFLSGDGTGKTSVMYVLTKGEKAPTIMQHSENLDVRERFFEFDENEQHYSVNTKLWDTSGEMAHKKLTKEFCTNATVAVITLDLKKLGNQQYTTELARAITWNWIDELNEVSPRCKLVFVGTKKDKVTGIELDQAKENVRHIANFESVRGRVGNRIMYTSAQKDNPQELRTELNRLIADAIKDYGLANLQDTPAKMSAKLVTEKRTKPVKKTMTKTATAEWSFLPRGEQKIPVTFEYTVPEEDPSATTYKIEYYGEF